MPLLALGVVALIAGIWGGLARMGWPLPTPWPVVVVDHGVLMVCGFLGTLIGVERAVALGRWWAFGAPLLTGLGGIAVLVAAPFGIYAIVAGSSLFLIVSVRVVVRQPTSFTILMSVGAASWVVGNVLWWVGRPIFSLVWWWVAFLLLTIVAERLELSRLMRRPSWATPTFLASCLLVLTGITTMAWWPGIGSRIAGAGMVGVALWLAFYDLARRTVQREGLARYVAVCLLGGYAWLTVCGVMLIASGAPVAGVRYDAILHAFFVGFVFSMIFGHAPIIFPAVLRISVPYRSLYYLPLALLHVSILVRIAGDLIGLADVRLWGGALNAIAIVGFIVIVASSTRRAAVPAAR